MAGDFPKPLGGLLSDLVHANRVTSTDYYEERSYVSSQFGIIIFVSASCIRRRRASAVWDNAEVVALLDGEGYIRAVSRNEDEAPIRNVLGKQAMHRVKEDSIGPAREAIQKAMKGETSELLVSATADKGYEFWSRLQVMPSHLEDLPVLVHIRRLPRSWGNLSSREKEVVHALHNTGMNPKRASKELGISENTLNAHRRSICQKCQLDGVGDFWVFVERCR